MKNLPAIPDLDARIARIVTQHTTIMASASQMAAAAAIAGLELKALKKAVGHGNWEEFFATKIEVRGLKFRTAQKYIALAEGLKGKALKTHPDAFLKLMEGAPSELSKSDQEKLTKVVAKMADGATISELYQDFGIVKKPQGSGAKGGKMTKKTEETGENANEENAATSEIPAGVDPQAWQLNTLLEEALKDGWWNDCTADFRRTLHGNLVDAQERIAKTLKGGAKS